MASVKCGVVWGRNPHGKDQIQIPRHRSVVLSLPHFHLFAPAVQYSKKTIPTHSHPAPAGCELLQLQKSRANLSSKPNRPDHQTEPIARPLLHTYYTASIHDTTAHSDRRPRNRRPDIITTASPTNRADQHGKHLSDGPRKYILRDAGFCQPRLLLLVRAQVFRL